jgi:predicted RNA binding protein YcfA (HicA-like mRNA interferase family)
MKRGELERRLRALGWYLLRHGGSHDIWAHRETTHLLNVPRHNVVQMGTARSILKQAGDRS